MVQESASDEETPLLSQNNQHGFPIDRDEIQRILGESHLDDGMSINSGQRQELVGEGGLKAWGRGKISVYDEGNCLMICDQDGKSSSSSSFHYVYSGNADNQGMCQSGRSTRNRRLLNLLSLGIAISFEKWKMETSVVVNLFKPAVS
jgi:hypothetical protein